MLMMRTVFKIMKVITSFMPVLLLPSSSAYIYKYPQHQPHTFILQTSLNHEMCLGWNVNRPESDRKGKGGEFLIQQNAWVDHKVAFMCAYIESKVKVVSEQYFYTTLYQQSVKSYACHYLPSKNILYNICNLLSDVMISPLYIIHFPLDARRKGKSHICWVRSSICIYVVLTMKKCLAIIHQRIITSWVLVISQLATDGGWKWLTKHGKHTYSE